MVTIDNENGKIVEDKKQVIEDKDLNALGGALILSLFDIYCKNEKAKKDKSV